MDRMDAGGDFETMLRNDDDLNNMYDISSSIGQGGQGSVVYAILRETGEEVALKLITLDELESTLDGGFKRTNAIRELQNHSRIHDHPFIVPLRGAVTTRYFLVIVMKYIRPPVFDNARSLAEKLLQGVDGMHEELARRFIQQVILAIHFCHELGIKCRDFKLEHCLLEDIGNNNVPKVRICDWGLSIGESISKSRVGTPGYWAPEVLIQNFEGGIYDPCLVDIYAIGVGLYRLVFGHEYWPFERPSFVKGKGVKSLYNANVKRVKQCTEGIQFPGEVSNECQDLLRGMLSQDCRKRYTMRQVLAHPWFRRNLPENALRMNLELIDDHRRMQVKSREEIEAILCRSHRTGDNCENYWEVSASSTQLSHRHPMTPSPGSGYST